jgi:hypothetical protein
MKPQLQEKQPKDRQKHQIWCSRRALRLNVVNARFPASLKPQCKYHLLGYKMNRICHFFQWRSPFVRCLNTAGRTAARKAGSAVIGTCWYGPGKNAMCAPMRISRKAAPEIAAVRTGRFDLLRKIRLPIRQASAAQALPQIACCGCDKIPVRTNEAASALKQAVENSMARTALRMSFHGSCLFG